MLMKACHRATVRENALNQNIAANAFASWRLRASSVSVPDSWGDFTTAAFGPHEVGTEPGDILYRIKLK